jgi:hypothetical protein
VTTFSPTITRYVPTDTDLKNTYLIFRLFCTEVGNDSLNAEAETETGEFGRNVLGKYQ